MAQHDGHPFSVRVVVALVAAGITAFAAFLLLAAYAGNLSTGRDGRGHALSVSGIGFAGLVQLVGSTGKTAALARSEQVLDTEDLVVVTVEVSTEPDALKSLIDRRRTRPTLVVLPKWLTMPDPANPAWVQRIGILPGSMVAHTLSKVAALDLVRTDLGRSGIAPSRSRIAPGRGRIAFGRGWLDGVSAPAPPLSQTLAGPQLTPLVVAPNGGVLLGRLGEAPLYILADPDLMNNYGIKDPGTARAALAILDQLNSTGAATVTFDLTANGLVQKRSPLRLMFEPPFLALTLALFVAALLAGLHGAFRFGPARREERVIALGKSALVENSASLIRMARREHRAGAAYAELIREAAAREASAPASLGGDGLDSYLDRISLPGSASFTQLAGRARAAADRAELLAAARALFSWKKEISQ